MPKPRRVSSEDILEVAEELFSRQGYGHTSLRQLMAATGLSPTAFYARYASKERVLEALVGRVLTDVFTLVSRAFAQSRSVETAFLEGVRAAVAGIAKHKVVMRLALTEAPNEPTIRPMVQGAYTAIAGVIRAYVENIAATRDVTVADPAATSWALVGGVLVHVTRWAVFDEIDEDQLASELERAGQLVLSAFAARA